MASISEGLLPSQGSQVMGLAQVKLRLAVYCWEYLGHPPPPGQGVGVTWAKPINQSQCSQILQRTWSEAITDKVAGVGLSWQQVVRAAPTAKIQRMAHDFPSQPQHPRSWQSHWPAGLWPVCLNLLSPSGSHPAFQPCTRSSHWQNIAGSRWQKRRRNVVFRFPTPVIEEAIQGHVWAWRQYVNIGHIIPDNSLFHRAITAQLLY